ncbi:hypothetical protein F511_32396 [Dorcoceras hygrometricum]|uniref:Uncharacterized protein n=1 Tax=Dorcoceras hygrometricum TaxID=472368 RepID=A0A2Z7BNM1_9LAMI|nr:hypothetical protein F511_32396 [Dorcoceras hygrometricum]
MDNAGMVAMFEALVASGLNGFLGCLSDIYEAALVEFFQNASVRDGQVISTVQGKLMEISEEVFARTFQLPVEGLMDLNEVLKDLVFDARSVFSFNGEKLSTSCKKREMKFEFRLLCDILAKSVTVKAGSLYAASKGLCCTNLYFAEKCMELGDSKEFPPLKILTAKTVGRYIAINENIGVEEVEDESRLKKTPAKKVASRKRPAIAVDAPVLKKKWTTSGKAVPKAKDLAIVSVALDAEPIQTVGPTSAMPAVHPPAPKRKAPKRKLRLTAVSGDEILAKEQAVEDAVLQQETTTSVDDVDNIILRVIVETTQMESRVMEPEVAGEIVTGTDFEEQVDPRTEDIVVETSEESMSIEDLLQHIRGDALLPSVLSAEPTRIKFSNGISIPRVAVGDLYKARLPKIALADKGKLREQVIDEVSAFLNYFSLRPVLEFLKDITVKERKVLTWAETDSVQIALQRRLYIVAKYRQLLLRKYLESHRAYFSFGQAWSAMALQIIDLLSIAHNAAVNESLIQRKAHALQWTRPCCSILFEDINAQFSQLRDSISQISIKQVRTQRILDDLKNELLFKIDNLAKAYAEAQDQQNQYIQNSLKNARQESRTQSDVLSVKLNEFHKGNRVHSAFVTTELADIRNEVKAMDEQLAKSDMLDFHAQAQENLLNLSTQLGFLVYYIDRGGDVKKGEGGSIRPQSPPDDQSRPSGGSGSRGSGGDGSSQRRGSGGSSQKRHSSSSGGVHHSSGGDGPVGPIRRDAEYWIYGKRQF